MMTMKTSSTSKLMPKQVNEYTQSIYSKNILLDTVSWLQFNLLTWHFWKLALLPTLGKCNIVICIHRLDVGDAAH
jgi:hypothetical protein